MSKLLLSVHRVKCLFVLTLGDKLFLAFSAPFLKMKAAKVNRFGSAIPHLKNIFGVVRVFVAAL